VNFGRTLFSQVMDFVPWTSFDRLVTKYGGDVRVRKFRCTEQFRAMAFAQLTFRESLRDIEACLSSALSCALAMPTNIIHRNGSAAALRVRAGDPREGARPRASRHGSEPQQSGLPATVPGRPDGGAATPRARAGDPREGGRPRASRHKSNALPSCPPADHIWSCERSIGPRRKPRSAPTKRFSAPTIATPRTVPASRLRPSTRWAAPTKLRPCARGMASSATARICSGASGTDTSGRFGALRKAWRRRARSRRGMSQLGH
jgi:hypothetical protein